jgi:hypothetical protein
MLDFYIQFREKNEIGCSKCNTEGTWVCIGAVMDILHLESIRTITVNLQKLQDIVKTLRDENNGTGCTGEVKIFFNFSI